MSALLRRLAAVSIAFLIALVLGAATAGAGGTLKIGRDQARLT